MTRWFAIQIVSIRCVIMLLPCMWRAINSWDLRPGDDLKGFLSEHYPLEWGRVERLLDETDAKYPRRAA